MRWAARKKVKTITLLADSFNQEGFAQKIKTAFLAWLLNQDCVEWVGNHGVNSCYSLQNIGVNPDKIIPWDWPHTKTPEAYSPKDLRIDAGAWSLIFVGSVIETKGVGDILRAIAKLRDQQMPVTLNIVGKGQIQQFSDQAKHLGIESAVQFLGLVPNNQIIQLMREADLVLVPSRHEYPEGLPLTIYEALCAHTPIIASDHPMFRGNLEHGVSAMIFPAGNADEIVNHIHRLLTESALYHTISAASYDTWKQLQIPVKWADFINQWLNNSPENHKWLSEHCLSSKRYQSAHNLRGKTSLEKAPGVKR